MKTLSLLILSLSLAVGSRAQPILQPHLQPLPLRGLPPGAPPPAVAAREPVNYLIRVEWKDSKAGPKFLEVLTTDGTFQLDTIQKNPVKIGNNEVPVTLKCNGTLTALDEKKGRLQLFLGRTIPFVAGSYSSGGSSYQQLSVGLQSTFIVQFGKSQVIQSDENGRVSVLVKRMVAD